MWKNWRRRKEQGPLGLSIGFYVVKFNVLLTMHHAMILANCPTW